MMMDDKENYEIMVDIAEHNAMFTNPEGVNKIREARKNTFSNSENEFQSTLESLFGRKLDENEEDISNKDNLNDYLNMDLDEVKFTPIRG